jgi:hypothetical protein
MKIAKIYNIETIEDMTNNNYHIFLKETKNIIFKKINNDLYFYDINIYSNFFNFEKVVNYCIKKCNNILIAILLKMINIIKNSNKLYLNYDKIFEEILNKNQHIINNYYHLYYSNNNIDKFYKNYNQIITENSIIDYYNDIILEKQWASNIKIYEFIEKYLLSILNIHENDMILKYLTIIYLLISSNVECYTLNYLYQIMSYCKC